MILLGSAIFNGGVEFDKTFEVLPFISFIIVDFGKIGKVGTSTVIDFYKS